MQWIAIQTYFIFLQYPPQIAVKLKSISVVKVNPIIKKIPNLSEILESLSQMDFQLLNSEVFNSWKRAFKKEVETFQKEVISKFQKTIDYLDGVYQTKYSSMIDQKDKKISELQNNLIEIQQFMNTKVGNTIGSNMDVEGKQIGTQRISTLKNSRPIVGDDKNIEQVRSSKHDQKKLNQNHIRQQSKEMEKSTKTERIQVIENYDPQFYPDLQMNHQSRERMIPRSVQKLPLLLSKMSHMMKRFSLKPNFTRLEYIEYSPKSEEFAFSQVNIEQLQNYDLREVGSINIQRQEMTDETFNDLSWLPWNIRSLQIDQNFITNLNPLRNFQYHKLMHLDVSNNQLTVDSAQLLATTKFDNIIYFTLSQVKNGPVNQCWEILLKNGMKNFPRLQAIDICSANNLEEEVRNKIIECMRLKSAEQRKKMVLNKEGKFEHYYPRDYEIKIRWIDSKEVFDKQSIQFAKEHHQKWIKEVDYKELPFKKQEVEEGQRSDSREQVPIRGRGRPRGRGEGRCTMSFHKNNIKRKIRKNKQLRP